MNVDIVNSNKMLRLDELGGDMKIPYKNWLFNKTEEAIDEMPARTTCDHVCIEVENIRLPPPKPVNRPRKETSYI